jgi:hypothetical protein
VLKTSPSERAVATESVLNFGQGCLGWLYLFNFNIFVFEDFVILKKSPHHEQAMLRYISGFMVRAEFRI